MKNRLLLTLLACLWLAVSTATAQKAKYLGSWTMTKSPIKDKCAKYQNITLRADGTATYTFGKEGDGCKKIVQEYKTWKVGKQSFKHRGKTVRKTVLVIGEHQDIIFYVEKKKRKLMRVTTDMVSGDTTKDVMITFKKS